MTIPTATVSTATLSTEKHFPQVAVKGTFRITALHRDTFLHKFVCFGSSINFFLRRSVYIVWPKRGSHLLKRSPRQCWSPPRAIRKSSAGGISHFGCRRRDHVGWRWRREHFGCRRRDHVGWRRRREHFGFRRRDHVGWRRRRKSPTTMRVCTAPLTKATYCAKCHKCEGCNF